MPIGTAGRKPGLSTCRLSKQVLACTRSRERSEGSLLSVCLSVSLFLPLSLLIRNETRKGVAIRVIVKTVLWIKVPQVRIVFKSVSVL